MSKMFKDEKFEEMDEISKLVEPYEYSLNNELAQLPDHIELTPEDFFTLKIGNSFKKNLRSDTLFRKKAEDMGLRTVARYAVDLMEDGMISLKLSSDLEIDIISNEIVNGRAWLEKKIPYYCDKSIEHHMKDFTRTEFTNLHSMKGICSRTKEICDLFGVEVADCRNNSHRIRRLRDHFISMIDNREMVIKDVDLYERFISWNTKYIADGNLPSLSNITRTKIMMRNGEPIYSIQEEET